MEKKGKISVLMPAYNAEKFICEAIESVINQSYKNWELLICDDASTDATYKCAKYYEKDKRVKIYRNYRNLHKAKTVQLLYKQSIGQIITIHDADDISATNRFATIVDYFSNYNNIDLIGHFIQRMTTKGRKLPLFRKKALDHEAIVQELKINNSSGDASLFFRRKVVHKIEHIYREYFKNNMDYDFVLRAIEHFKIMNIEDCLYYYRNVPNSISKDVENYKKLITPKISLFLHNERITYGSDALQRGEFEILKSKEAEFSYPYQNDKTLHLREMASFFMYSKMERNAIQYMWKAIKQEPLKFKNWRTFQYCLRKMVFNL